MNGTIQVTAGAPESVNVSAQDNKFVPPLIQVRPGGTVNWQNDGNHEHIVFSAGGGAPNFCLNGRAFVGKYAYGCREIQANGYAGIYSTWIFPASGTTFTPIRFAGLCRAPTGGASDVHGLSPLEAFVTDTEVPPAMRLPRALEEFQHDPSENACRVRIHGDFLFHCHIEEHMMAGLAGLVRARQYIWISDRSKQNAQSGITV